MASQVAGARKGQGVGRKLGQTREESQTSVLTIAEDFFENVFGTMLLIPKRNRVRLWDFEEAWQSIYYQCEQGLLRTYTKAGKVERKQVTFSLLHQMNVIKSSVNVTHRFSTRGNF